MQASPACLTLFSETGLHAIGAARVIKTAIQITHRFKRNFREVSSLVFSLVRRAGADRMRRRVRPAGRAGAAWQAGLGWSARESGRARSAGQAWSSRPSGRTRPRRQARPPCGKSVRQQRRYRCPGQPDRGCRALSRKAMNMGPGGPASWRRTERLPGGDTKSPVSCLRVRSGRRAGVVGSGSSGRRLTS